MLRFDERAELAPRDIVARAVDYRVQRLNIHFMYGWTLPINRQNLLPNTSRPFTRLLELGIDITKDMIPVVPAAHYTCGGVVVDELSLVVPMKACHW